MDTLSYDIIEHIASMVCLIDAVSLSMVSTTCRYAISHDLRAELYTTRIHNYIRRKKELFVREISLLTSIPLHIVDKIDQKDIICYDNKTMNDIIHFFVCVY
ncbi:MAG: hypothetical protein CMM25_05415 [Rhodospirillaceae bacterium]|nr:hypothetical protein [Rhodospirillaceae bacterium]